MKTVNTALPSQSLSISQLKNAFFTLKARKSHGADEINFNVIKHCFGELCGPLKYLFVLSSQNGFFPGLMKISIVSPVLKTGDTVNIRNSRPISVLPCFSKILECLERIIFYKNTLLIRKPYTHKSLDQIYESFENGNYTVGIFVDLSNAFDIINHTILLKKLEIYVVTGTNLVWFRSYLTSRKQYICINNDNKTNE